VIDTDGDRLAIVPTRLTKYDWIAAESLER
jgi:hypothetical protein